VAKAFLESKRAYLAPLALIVALGCPAMAQARITGADQVSSDKVAKWPQASLQAAASAQVEQDTVRIVLAAQVNDSTQQSVSQALSRIVQAALDQAKGNEQVKAYTGQYSVWPFTDDKGRLTRWQGRAEVVLESTHFDQASSLAGKLSQDMAMSGVTFSVSDARRAKLEAQLLDQAAQAFRDRAQAAAKAFGFPAYEIRDINIGGDGIRYEQAPRMMSMAADKTAAVPLQGSTQQVTVTVQGRIFLLRHKNTESDQ